MAEQLRYGDPEAVGMSAEHRGHAGTPDRFDLSDRIQTRG
jgi:hypothetical protein